LTTDIGTPPAEERHAQRHEGAAAPASYTRRWHHCQTDRSTPLEVRKEPRESAAE
jgi:hypothetical protein